MNKRLFSFAVALLMLAFPTARAGDGLAFMPESFPGSLGVDATLFYLAYSTLCDTVLEPSPTKRIREEAQEGYGLDTYVRKDTVDVQVLYRLSDGEVIAVAFQTNVDESSSLAGAYATGETFGQTLLFLLITQAFLKEGPEQIQEETLLTPIRDMSKEALTALQDMISRMKNDETELVSNTLRHQDWYLTYRYQTYNHSGTVDSMSIQIFLHGQPL